MVDPNKVMTFELSPKFWSFLKSVHVQHPPKYNTRDIRITALDPGGTTGHSTFNGHNTINVTQWNTNSIPEAYDRLVEHLNDFRPHHMRHEDYRIYEWKSADHSWSPVHTLRWIGAIEVAAHVTKTPNTCLMASNAKKFWDDRKLDMFGINPKGLRHGRDALRHLLYYMCFPT
jgi:hypothetical protein